MKVLIPTDFSAAATKALNYAQMLFEGASVEFHLLHACQAPTYKIIGNRSPRSLSAAFATERSKQKVRLDQYLEDQVGKSSNQFHNYYGEVHLGTLKEVLDSVRWDSYDFVVMGTRGATGLKEVFWGSNAYDVARMLPPVPVLFVPEHATFSPLKTIGFATDFRRPFTAQQLRSIKEIASLWKATIHMIEVYRTPELNEEQERNLEALQLYFKDLEHEFHVISAFGNLESCIAAFDEELEVELLVLINYPKSFFQRLGREPIIKKELFHSQIPVLIISATG
ncbi:universal stress protein [Croceiramulus getboli]|nr:universal stress protein [Flavobacteriaceae bacterium YJPT1-3]